MKLTRHRAEQIICKLKTAEQMIAQDKTDADICRVIKLTQPTYHRWRQQYGGMQAEEARRLAQVEKENARLKKLLAEAELEKAMLKDLAEVSDDNLVEGRFASFICYPFQLTPGNSLDPASSLVSSRTAALSRHCCTLATRQSLIRRCSVRLCWGP
jgi:putative transposase